MWCELGLACVADADAMVESYFASKTIDGLRHVVLIAYDPETDAPIGMAEVSLRDFADGCSSNPVGYFKGWFVEEHARGHGVGRAILEAAKNWARARRVATSSLQTLNWTTLGASRPMTSWCSTRCTTSSVFASRFEFAGAVGRWLCSTPGATFDILRYEVLAEATGTIKVGGEARGERWFRPGSPSGHLQVGRSI
ncbi:MAG: GNAT family N-acetyltransferase [Planctomycetota bacterium]